MGVYFGYMGGSGGGGQTSDEMVTVNVSADDSTSVSGLTVTLHDITEERTEEKALSGSVATFYVPPAHEYYFSFEDKDGYVTPADSEHITSVRENVRNVSAVYQLWTATINITYPAGSTCTVTKDGVTVNAPDTSGTWDYVVHEAGTYTADCTDGTLTASQEIEVTTHGASYPMELSYFTATITVTADVSGATVEDTSVVTLKKDDAVIESWTVDSDTHTFAVHSAGTYELSMGNGTDNADDVEVAITEDGQSESVSLSYLVIVTWADGTDYEVSRMIEAAQAGKIDLSDFWEIGQERVVTVSAMGTTGTDVWNDGALDGTESFTVSETQAEQDVTLVIMHFGDVPLADGNNCKMVIGQKDVLSTAGIIHNSRTNSGSWGSMARRKWCNNTYFNALPEYIRTHLKPMITKTSLSSSGSDWNVVNDRVALTSAAQIFESSPNSYITTNEFSSIDDERVLKQWDWYKTEANRIKKLGISGSADAWWGRTPVGSQKILLITTSGVAYGQYTSYVNESRGISPFFCF